MNPRIFELWEQSTGAAVPEEGFYSSASKYNIEKFAELIVQECLHIVDDEGAGEGGCIRAMIRIQDEFGIEA